MHPSHAGHAAVLAHRVTSQVAAFGAPTSQLLCGQVAAPSSYAHTQGMPRMYSLEHVHMLRACTWPQCKCMYVVENDQGQAHPTDAGPVCRCGRPPFVDGGVFLPHCSPSLLAPSLFLIPQIRLIPPQSRARAWWELVRMAGLECKYTHIHLCVCNNSRDQRRS